MLSGDTYRGRTLKELEVTSESLPGAFFVLYAIAVEDLLISAAAKKGLEINQFKTLPDLAFHLYKEGVITPTILEFANDAWESRNRALHGQQGNLQGLSPQEHLAKFKRLLDDYGWIHERS